MKEKQKIISAIRNPLSIIAIFVFLIEGLATIALTNDNLTESQRYWFVIFCTVFPLLVFSIFSLIAWFKPLNFYGPQDYLDDKVFLLLMKKGKIEDEVDDIIKSGDPEGDGKMTIVSNVLNAEQKAYQELQKEFHSSFLSEIRSSDGTYLFDGIIQNGKNLIYIEVKYLPNGVLRSGIIGQLKRFVNAAGKNAEKIIAIVTRQPLKDAEKRMIEKSVKELNDRIDIRFYVL